MGEHAAQFHVPVAQHAGDRLQPRILRHDAAAMPVTVDLDEHRRRTLRRRPGRHQCVGLLERVDHHLDIQATRVEGLHARDPVGREPDAVDHVGQSVSREILRLLERRDRDGASRSAEQPPCHIDRLAGLDVRTKADPERCQTPREPLDIAVHLRDVEHERGRVDVHERQRSFRPADGWHTPSSHAHGWPRHTPRRARTAVRRRGRTSPIRRRPRR